MISLRGIHTKLGGDELIWLWPWRRGEAPNLPYISKVLNKRFKSRGHYEEHVGVFHKALITKPFHGFKLLDLLSSYSSFTNPDGASLIIIGHNIAGHLESEGHLGLISKEKASLLKRFDSLVIPFGCPVEAAKVLDIFRGKVDGFVCLVSRGQVTLTNSYLNDDEVKIDLNKILRAKQW